MRPLIFMLAAAIAFTLITDPRNSQTTAQQDPDRKADMKSVADCLVQVDRVLHELTDRVLNHSRELESIEQCHAEELEQIKSRLVHVESDEPAASSCQCDCDERINKLEADVAQLKSRPVSSYPAVSSSSGYGSTGTPVVSSGSTGTPIVSYRSTATTAATPVRNVVQRVVEAPRWQNYDGLTRRQHLEQAHGLNTAGMSEADLIRAQNAYHDTYGPGHPVKMPTMPVTRSSNCPDGVCPTGPTSTRSSSSGWWLGKNLGRR